MAHTCHWPKCNKHVPPKMWGCKFHWYMLPKYLRDKIWDAYRLGQEIDKNPSDEYMEVAMKVQRWIRDNYSV